MKFFATTAVLVAVLGAQPAAALEIPPDAEMSLWCDSAMLLLAKAASDSGDTSAAASFLRFSHDLDVLSRELLTAAGFDIGAIEAMQIDSYTEVRDELAADTPHHSPDECGALVKVE